MVSFGPVQECLAYFTGLSYRHLPGQNPADFIVLVGGAKFAPGHIPDPNSY